MKPGPMPYAAEHGNLPLFIDAELHKLPSGFLRLEFPDSGCWLWTGAVGKGGYGNLWLPGVGYRNAHRVMYEFIHGPVSKRRDVAHICEPEPVKLCVNPAHLRVLRHKENLRMDRERRGPRTHCRAGHELTEANSYPRTDRPGVRCRMCMKARTDANSSSRPGSAGRRVRVHP